MTDSKPPFAQPPTKGLWKGTYAGSNRDEYWAEAVQDWFDNNRENDALHNHVNTRAELTEYDPALAQLCAEVLGDNPWRYHKPADSARRGASTSAGVEWDKLPAFRWRDRTDPRRAARPHPDRTR